MLAGAGYDGQQPSGFAVACNGLQVFVERRAELGRDHVTHGDMKKFFHAVSQESGWGRIDGKQIALQVVNTEQVSAMFYEITLPVCVAREILPDQPPRAWLVVRAIVWLCPRVRRHGSSSVKPPAVGFDQPDQLPCDLLLHSYS